MTLTRNVRNVRNVALIAVLLSVASPIRAQQPASNPLDVVPEKVPFDIPYGGPILLEDAQAAITAAVAEAKKRDWKMSIAVLDSGGNLVAFQRMDQAPIAEALIAEQKARTAVSFRRETKVFESFVQNGATYLVTLPGVVASRGGIPLIVQGKVVGAIGCAGGTGSQDEVVCKAGAAIVK